jgi:hypothetical protein
LLRTTGLLAVAMTITGTALASETPRVKASETPRVKAAEAEGRRLGIRLDRERLAPRVSIELESFSTFHQAAEPGVGLQDHVMFDEMTRTVRRGTKSVTRKAIRNYVLEAVRLDRGIDHVRESIRGSRHEKRDLDFHFGVSHMLPELGMRLKSGAGTMGFNVGIEGDAGLRFSANRFERAEFSISFDGEDTFKFRARLGF